MTRILKNARIWQPGGAFVTGGLRMENGRIAELYFGHAALEEGEDLQGHYLIPGLVDMHIHGCLGEDCSDGSPEGLGRIAAFLASRGVTSFAPTSMTLPGEQLQAAFSVIGFTAADQQLQSGEEQPVSRIAGIHMEGPYLSAEKCGSQKTAFLQQPDPDGFAALQEVSGNRIRVVDIAPELPGAENFIRRAADAGVTVSIAHTKADYEQACGAFQAGASHVTHLFNAMPPMLHREPGVIGAAAEHADVTVELISDGLHVHPSVVRVAFQLFPHRICLISDAIRCLGMPDGIYECGGQSVRLSRGEARIQDGTIAGSVTDLYACMQRAISFGIPAWDAVEAASFTPAGVLGIGDETGSIETGKWADLIVCDEAWNRERVYVRGMIAG